MPAMNWEYLWARREKDGWVVDGDQNLQVLAGVNISEGAMLAQVGGQGWELVCVDQGTFYFKRA